MTTMLPAGPLLPASQRAAIAAVNATAAPVAEERLEAAFLAQVARAPGAVAVVSAAATLTYAEVAARAAGVAEAVRAAGAGRGAIVAVMLESGWAPVVAVVGIELAGAAYLPIDPETPDERVARLLADAAVAVVVTEPAVAARHAWPAGVTLVDVGACGLGPLVVDAARGGADALAYVIYTSGSTGQPKGVMLTHRSAVNTVRDITARFGIGPGDRLLAVSALSFDLSVYDIFGGLGAGATVVLPPAGATRDPRVWWELVAQAGVTVWNSVPALLGLVVEYGTTVREAAGRGGLGTLRLALLSGDWIPLSLPEAVRALAPGCQVVSLGGATEAAIWSVVYPVERVDAGWTSVPYGRPLTNQRAYVLNEALQLCPVWVAGELYLAGEGLAQGYWGDAERTAARFLVHPQTGERLYRTGDRARYRPDGTLELLGRVDTQLKLHGHRIEPGEIEAALLQHPHVHAAVVVVPDAGPRRLAACIVPAAASGPSAEALRDHLASILPPSLVPTCFEMVDALPLTANGKVDRRAVAALPFAPATVAQVPENGEIDAGAADAIAAVLQRGSVAANVRLLDLGADSMLLIQIANRLETLSGRRPPLEFLFQNPTIEELVAAYGPEAEHV